MNIKRYFTSEKWFQDYPGLTVFDMFKWKKVDVEIKDYNTNKILFSAKDLEFPEHYSQSACDIIAKMYFRKSGVPSTGHEVSLRQVIDRMVNFWCKAALDEKLITIDEARIVYDELAYAMVKQMWAPNSPQWFNTGLYHSYGIKGEANGLSYFDLKKNKVVECKDAYSRTQASACFIVGIKDSLLGEQSLMDNLTTASRLFKYGSGIGSNWSEIRGEGEKLSSGGKSSGLLSFQKVFDRNAGAIKSGGTTRRAAVMQVLDIDHPEVEDFIKWKSIEEDKVVALGKMGYDTSISGEAYATVSGQNVNNSISISDTFMEMVTSPMEDEDDDKWTLKGRNDSSVNKIVSAKKLWDDIAKCAWKCGDPGLQFSDNINYYNTCLESGKIRASNPCGEYLFLDDTACNLASINIMKFFDANNLKFDLKGYLHLIGLIQIALEASIHWGAFPTNQIAHNTHLYRTTGLGLTNVGSMIMAMGMPYDSMQARTIIAALCNIMTAKSYHTSALMAKRVGAFPEFEKNRDYMENVIHTHKLEWPISIHNECINGDYLRLFFNKDQRLGIELLWDETIDCGKKYGYRNAQVTVIAPTGTIAFAMDCDSTSIEPFFSHKAYKKLVDGSYMTIVNNMIPVALKNLDYTEDQIKDITDYIMNGDGNIEGAPHLKEEHLVVFDTANRCGSGTRYISPEGHVKMVAAISSNISGGISKTVNMPADATVEDIKKIYELAWKLVCKGITVYRDGSKACQPLNTTVEDVKNADDLENMTYAELLKLAKSLMEEKNNAPKHECKCGGNCDGHDHRRKIERERLPYEPKCIKNSVKMDGTTYHINRSFYDDGRLGEIFVSCGKQGNTVKGLTETLCILISKCLQYGIPPETISEMMRGSEFSPNGMVLQHSNIKAASSIPDLISKFIDISAGDYRFCQVKPEVNNEIIIETPIMKVEVENKNNTIYSSDAVNISEIKGEKVYGKTCHECGSSHMTKIGTCYYCQDCGSSTGCS